MAAGKRDRRNLGDEDGDGEVGVRRQDQGEGQSGGLRDRDQAGYWDNRNNREDSGPTGILPVQRTGKTLRTGQTFQVKKTRLTELT
jgi:hypothetical protein